MQVSNTPSAVLRILNGPLQGAEFVLEQACTLFVVGSQAVFCDAQHPADVPSQAIYVPFEGEGCNFEVLLTDNSRDGCVLRVAAAEGTQEREVLYQKVLQVQGLLIALKPAQEEWQTDLVSVTHSALPRADLPLWRKPLPLPVLSIVGAAMLALLLICWLALRSSPVTGVEQLLAGASESLRVVQGRDGGVYVFPEGEREAGWARQVLMRNAATDATVVATFDEQQRLRQSLARHHPELAYHRIDLSDIQQPQLWLSQQRAQLSASYQHALNAWLLAEMPYARKLDVRHTDDQLMLRRAEQGLARLNVAYDRVLAPGNVTFTVRGALEDAELLAVRDYVNEYYRLWGDRYIHFAVELKDDWLKGKSFQYGPSGYIKMTPSSWYFPKPL